MSDFQDSALSPESLVELIKFTTPSPTVKVKGKVTRLTPFPKENPKYYYGTLESIFGEGSVSFRCNADSAPAAAFQYAIIEGVISLKPLKFSNQAGMEILLTGNCLGSFSVSTQKNYKLRLDSRVNPKIKFKAYIEKQQLSGAILIGTKIAVNDIVNTMHYSLDHFKCVETVSFGDTKAILEIIDKHSPTAVIFTRGGDDETMGLWDSPDFVEKLVNLNKPFYTALGHAHRITLADHYADQSFLTPSDLGHSIKDVFQELSDTYKLKEVIKKTSAEKNSLEVTLNNQQLDHNHRVAGYTSTIKNRDQEMQEKNQKIKTLKTMLTMGFSMLTILLGSLGYVSYRWMIALEESATISKSYTENLKELQSKQNEANSTKSKKIKQAL